MNIVCIYPNPHRCHGLMSGWDPSFHIGGVGEATGSPAAREGGKGKQWGSVGVSECRLETARNAEFLGAKSLVRKAHRKRPAKRK